MMYIDGTSYASDEALGYAREGDGKFTLAYIVAALAEEPSPSADTIATAIEMARAYAPNLLKADAR